MTLRKVLGKGPRAAVNAAVLMSMRRQLRKAELAVEQGKLNGKGDEVLRSKKAQFRDAERAYQKAVAEVVEELKEKDPDKISVMETLQILMFIRRTMKENTESLPVEETPSQDGIISMADLDRRFPEEISFEDLRGNRPGIIDRMRISLKASVALIRKLANNV